MGLIKNRIDAEYRKHKNLDWSRIAEAKILTEMKELVNYIFRSYPEKSKEEVQAELIERLNKRKWEK